LPYFLIWEFTDTPHINVGTISAKLRYSIAQCSAMPHAMALLIISLRKMGFIVLPSQNLLVRKSPSFV